MYRRPAMIRKRTCRRGLAECPLHLCLHYIHLACKRTDKQSDFDNPAYGSCYLPVCRLPRNRSGLCFPEGKKWNRFRCPCPQFVSSESPIFWIINTEAEFIVFVCCPFLILRLVRQWKIRSDRLIWFFIENENDANWYNHNQKKCNNHSPCFFILIPFFCRLGRSRCQPDGLVLVCTFHFFWSY